MRRDHRCHCLGAGDEAGDLGGALLVLDGGERLGRLVPAQPPGMGEDTALDVVTPAAAIPFEPGAERLAVAEIVGMAAGKDECQRLVAVRNQRPALRRLLRSVIDRTRLPDWRGLT